jgi:hypothetical protein
VHQIQIDIVGAEVLEGGIEGCFDVLRVMGVVPKLGRKEDLVARNAALSA